MNCKEARELFYPFLNNDLSPDERSRLQAHLAVCAVCREELAGWQLISGALKRVASLEVSPPPGFHQRLMARLTDLAQPVALPGHTEVGGQRPSAKLAPSFIKPVASSVASHSAASTAVASEAVASKAGTSLTVASEAQATRGASPAMAAARGGISKVASALASRSSAAVASKRPASKDGRPYGSNNLQELFRSRLLPGRSRLLRGLAAAVAVAVLAFGAWQVRIPVIAENPGVIQVTPTPANPSQEGSKPAAVTGNSSVESKNKTTENGLATNNPSEKTKVGSNGLAGAATASTNASNPPPGNPTQAVSQLPTGESAKANSGNTTSATTSPGVAGTTAKSGGREFLGQNLIAVSGLLSLEVKNIGDGLAQVDRLAAHYQAEKILYQVSSTTEGRVKFLVRLTTSGENFDALWNGLTSVGTVLAKRTSQDDVSAAYAETQKRINDLATQRQTLAASAPDSPSVKALDEEIAALQTRLKDLEAMTKTASIVLWIEGSTR